MLLASSSGCGGSSATNPAASSSDGRISAHGGDCSVRNPKYPSVCDDGKRLEHTGDATIDALLQRMPTQCAKKAIDRDFVLDGEPDDPDSSPVQKKTNICQLAGAYYWVADMDVDCDGRPTVGKCGKDLDKWFQADTSTQATRGGPLEAAVTPYVVIPTVFNGAGLAPGSVMAVVYRNKMTYAVFGDTIPNDVIGEASYACAERLGIPPSAIDGGVVGHVVTYVAFAGPGNVPRNNEDQDETRAIGERLTAALIANNPLALPAPKQGRLP